MSNHAVESLAQARARRLASHCHFEHSIGRVCLGCAFLGEQPTFDCFTNIRADIVYRFALGNASRQCWHFRPVSTFFRFMNEHFQCHRWILAHRPIARKTDLCLLASINNQHSALSFLSPPPSINFQLSAINFPVPVFTSLLPSVIATKIAIAMGQIRFRRNVPVNAAANDS